MKQVSWDIKGQNEFYNKKEQGVEKVNSNYNKLFENAANFEDSVKIYQEYGLPLKLEEPSFKDKERILEGRVK